MTGEVKYSESVAPEGDTRSEVLEILCEGQPWLLIVAHNNPQEPNTFNLKLECGGGISRKETIKALLEKTLRALP